MSWKMTQPSYFPISCFKNTNITSVLTYDVAHWLFTEGSGIPYGDTFIYIGLCVKWKVCYLCIVVLYTGNSWNNQIVLPDS
jgi:hypothetical protein